MAMFSKGLNFRALAAGLRQSDLAMASVASFALMLIAGTAVVSSAGLHRFALAPSKTHDVRLAVAPKGDSPWGAAPDSRLEGQPSAMPPNVRMTSASYTSGFDRSAAGLGPLPTPAPTKAALQTDARICPDNLNCTFRPAKAGAVAVVTPPHRIVTEPSKPATPQQANNFAFLTANLHWPEQLPLANNLLKPFSYVGDRVADFVKKL